MRVAVLMSGGVDSSVALALMLEQGHECAGVSLLFHPDSTCCRPQDIEDAAAVAKKLGAKHIVVDVREAFSDKVIKPFVEGYSSGKTPNPCPICNAHIKFGLGLRWATSQGFDRVASGHYARINLKDSEVFLERAKDANKSQEYFLALVPAENLRRAVFPLGELTKDEVRTIAKAKGLPLHEKPESQDVCFIRGDLRRFLRDHLGERPGRFLDARGKSLGHHDGYYTYTVGQRRGHGVATGKRAYVIRIEPPDVILGTREEACSKILKLTSVNRFTELSEGDVFMVRVRYGHEPGPAVLVSDSGNEMTLEFKDPQFAIVPGQIGVLYRGDRVVAGGIIAQ
ncbi:MAG: tRNA 2-thiouridine(34) synthase MnmA [candidate division WOR-3 bacterium]